MNHDRSHPDAPLTPESIEEGDLLALVEGLPIPAERAALVRQTLAADPSLAELVSLLRADRDVLVTAATPAAPVDLLDRVEARMEREALVGLARSESAAASDDLPVSVVQPFRRTWTPPRYVLPLSAAAAVALVAGGMLMMIPRQRPLTTGADQASNDKPIPVNDPAKVNPVVVAPVDLAVRPTDPPVNPAAVGLEAPVGPTVIAKAPEFTAEELLTAAREGRLVLRLRTPSEGAVEGRLSAFAGNTRGLSLQPMSADQASHAAGVYAGTFTPRPAPLPAFDRPPIPDQPLAANNPAPRGTPRVIQPSSPEPSHPDEPAPQMSSRAYVATVPATIEGLDALRKSLGSENVPAEWRLLSTRIVQHEPSDAASIMWWTVPPAQWTGRLSVPIVVQTN